MTASHAWIATVVGVAIFSCGTPRPLAPSSARARPTSERRFALPPGCAPQGASFVCNPLTNAGCDVSKREACDEDDADGFECNEPPNYVKEGGECDAEEGPSCLPSMGCEGATERDPSGKCARFCCTDAECRGGKTCHPSDPKFGSFGFCG